jgi:CubicO group peptidase (beta-lactamase class C family)
MKELVQGLEQTASETAFSGVISIFNDASIVFSKAFGYRDIKNKLPNTTGTNFGIASGTKVFTALGIGVLVDQGLISLGTTIREIDQENTGFVDEYATIQHLLTHTSGIYDYYDEEIEQDFEHFTVEIPWCELETPSDYYPLFKNKPMKFPPGVRYSYSNGGYVFLGMIIEKLTGVLYRDFVHEHILKAAGMHNSGFYAFNEDDLRSFWDSLFSNRILSAELTKTYLNTHYRFNDTDGYGCGIYKRLDDSMFSIVGGDAGVGFDSRYLVQGKLTVNILSNITNGENAIRDVLLGFI